MGVDGLDFSGSNLNLANEAKSGATTTFGSIHNGYTKESNLKWIIAGVAIVSIFYFINKRR